MVRALLKNVNTIGLLTGTALLVIRIVHFVNRHALHGWPRQVIQPWPVIASLFIPTILFILVRTHDRIRWYIFCPVCGTNIGANSIECRRCGSDLKDGAIPCRASIDIPEGIDTSPVVAAAVPSADSRVVIRGDIAKLRETFSQFSTGLFVIALGGEFVLVPYFGAHWPDHWLSFEGLFALIPITMLFFGLIVVAVGLILIVFPKRMRLDRKKQTLHLSLGSPGKDYSFNQRDAAIQMTFKIISGYRSYKCYEVNFISAKDRINLLSHGDAKSARYDAKRLADFLNVKLLDHTNEIISRSDGSPGYRLIEKGSWQKEVTLASS